MNTTRSYKLGFSLSLTGAIGAARSLAEMVQQGVTGVLVVALVLSFAIAALGWVIVRREAKVHGVKWDFNMASAWFWGALMLAFGLISTADNLFRWTQNQAGMNWSLITVDALEVIVGVVGLLFILRDNSGNKATVGGDTK
jgi:hypothetical protein